jgi:fatty-acyl-CoA synthase
LVTSILNKYGTGTASERTSLKHGNFEVSYHELRAAVTNAEKILRIAGMQLGDGLALLMDNSPEFIVWMLAGLEAGYRYTPLHPLASATDICYILEDGEIRTLVLGRRFSDLVEALPSNIAPSRLEASACWRTVPDDGVDLCIPTVSSDELAMLAYTGGSTGRPKGVILSHRAVRQCVLMELAEWPWPQEPRFLAMTPLSHGAGFMVLPTLYKGGVVLTSEPVHGLSPAAAISSAEASVVFMVPSLMYRLLDEAQGSSLQLPSLRMAVYGGSPIASNRLRECLDVLPVPLVQLYGQTEAPMIVASLLPEEHDECRPWLLSSCGTVVAGAELLIVGPDGEALPKGEVGEVCVRGPLTMDGYWGQEESSSNAMGRGWLRTGDLGKLDSNGYLYIVDRMKDMVISGGFNIYPAEVEATLIQNSRIRAAAVFGVADPMWVEKLVAVVVRADPSLSEAEVKAYVREHKGPIQVPKEIRFLDDIPLTPVGKPDKVSLRVMFEPAPSQ